jgi:tetratricopeptide (TPR) repeat protein
MNRFLFCLLLFAFCLPPEAAAQRLQPAPHPAHVIPKVPLELVQRSVAIRAGIGEAHDAVGTASAEAQRFYDQGLAYLHSYVWIEAARSFNQALRLDPTLAIAHAALSLAYVELNLPEASRAALAQARSRAAGASDHDRRHIELRALQSAAEDAGGAAAALTAYRSALDAALVTFPKDAELWLLRGMAESPDPAERGQGSTAASVKYYERAQALAPAQFAARHYLAHAFENGGQIEQALAHAAAYARAAANVPHARHMHGHSLRRAGRVHEAIAEFEAADKLHASYLAQEKIGAEYDWHYHHNLDLLGTSYQYVGQMKKAEALLKASFALPSNLVAQLFNKREWPVFLRARARYREALDAAAVLMQHPHPLIKATGHMEAGFTVLATNQFADAAEQYNAALKILRPGPEGAPMAARPLLALQGELALRTAQRERGRQVFEDVARRLRAAPGPDNWVQALFALEAMARAARAVGDWDLAGRMAAQMIAHDPAYAGSHYAAALVAERNDDAATARAEFALAQKYWAKADPDLPELAEIRKRIK